MDKRGIHLHPDTHVRCIERLEDGTLDIIVDNLATVQTDLLLFATGRVPNTEGLGLEEVGVELNKRGGIVVDDKYDTSVPHIHAVGDVTDNVQLTPVALAEGMALARRLFGGPDTTVNYDTIPSAVFSQPNVGTVGISEGEARKRFDKVRIYKSTFTPMKHTLTKRNEKTLMKIVVDDASDRVVGVHVVGPDAGEIVQGFAVAMTCGATKAQLDATIGIHPTAAEELVTMRTPEPDPEDLH
jgi:glutathione reductase (NADPH)